MLRPSIFVVLALVLAGTNGVVIDQKEVTPFLTLTFVHGDDAARMSHSEARRFCMDLPELLASGKVKVNNARSMWKSGSAPNDGAAPRNRTRSSSRTYGDLMSIHDPTMVHELMAWVLPMEKKQFWIGGIIRRIAEEFQNRPHFIQAWSDSTPANFRYLHFSNEELDTLEVGDTKCLSVDYASGKWGVHDCGLRMYFVCESITLPDVAAPVSAEANETRNASGPGTSMKTTPTTGKTPLMTTLTPN
ncbi:unnamed protein product [Calicophoron daubneyi]|uniref:C-type lectin domain-containing protein n=1 Tax=Calicophoron daubneyi TaxID=300641 RepID=A0AAV2SZ61_CALDB